MRSRNVNMFVACRSLFLITLTVGVALANNGTKSRKYCDETHTIKGGRVRRIIGGSEALPNEFPHMALLGYVETYGIVWLCGGSLISDKYILTGASCITRKIPKYVKMGDVNLESSRGKIIEIARIVAHPSFTAKKMYNDIGLIELKHAVEFSDFIKPACLNVEKTPGSNGGFITIGWGVTSFNGDQSQTLQKVTLEEVSTEECNESYKKNMLERGIQEDSQICAVGINKNTCQGDSGGPLQILNPTYISAYDIYGVTSFGKSCGSKIPGVYTRVSHYIDWIESVAFSP